MTPLEKELRSALNKATDWIAKAQRDGCPAGIVAVPSPIRDALRFADRIEAAEGCKIIGDGHTVWVNARDGWCIARFSRTGIDIHSEITPATEPFTQTCLYCRPGWTKREDWDIFVERMQALYGVTVRQRYMPRFLRQTEKS